MEIYNFLREVLLSKDGVEVVLSCGGKSLCETLRAHVGSNQQSNCLLQSKAVESDSRRTPHQKSHPSLQLTSEIATVASTLLLQLEKAAAATPEECAKSTVVVLRRTRDGDEEYDEYVTKILRKERSCLFKTFYSGSLKPSKSGGNLATPLDPYSLPGDADHADSQAEDCESEEGILNSDREGAHDGIDDHDEEPDMIADDEDAELENEGNDDGSDGDGSEEDDATIGLNLELCDLAEANQAVIDGEEAIGFDLNNERLRASNDQTKLSPPKTFTVKGWSTSVDFSKYEDKLYYYESLLGIKHPKHPSRCYQGSSASEGQCDDVLGQPTPSEPCKAPSQDAMNAFIEQASVRRTLFLQSNPSIRAELVYDSKSHFDNLGSSETPPSTKTPMEVDPFPYPVPKKSCGASQGNNDSLTFDSCFESGNLERAVQIGEWEYDLFLRRDFNTNGHMQWFYFAVSNIRIRVNSTPSKYRFNIINLCKSDSLFNQGLQPVVYSVKDAHLKHTGWLRSGTEIYYFSNPFPRFTKGSAKSVKTSNERSADAEAQNQPAASGGETYFTLTFTLDFANPDDTYLIAHSYPYTLTDHHEHLERISRNLSGQGTQSILRRTILCKTLSGKNCDLLSISDFSSSMQEQKARRAVIISSRVHPGEVQASWMMRGVIDFLVGESDIARVLRRLFLFQIIPVLNPDGVYYGNSRCSLAACDLNRQWHHPSETYHPTIFHTKELLKKEQSIRGVVLFCDLHGHSRKKNVFLYGCDTKKRPNPRSRAFAKLFSMQQTARKYISFPDCSFKISKSKETTARVVVANELKLCLCFTLEASFCGGNFGELQGMHYNTHHMAQVGSSLCETLYQACISDASVREKLTAMVDDYSANFTGYAENLLRESGIVSDASGLSAFGREGGAATPRKTRAAGGGARRNSSEAKVIRRKISSSKSSKALGDSKSQQSDSRKPKKKQSRGQIRHRGSLVHSAVEFTETREAAVDVTSPRPYLLSSTTQVQDHLNMPRAKMSGKKLRNKKKKVKKESYPSDETGNCQADDDTMPSIATYAAHVQEANRKPLSIGREAGSSSSSTSSGSSTPLVLTKPSVGSLTGVVMNPSLRSSVGCLQLADSIMTIISRPLAPPPPDAYGSDHQPRETASVILPPPVGDLLVRSPKLKPSGVRFR